MSDDKFLKLFSLIALFGGSACLAAGAASGWALAIGAGVLALIVIIGNQP